MFRKIHYDKNAVIEEYITGKQNVEEIVKKYDISSDTLYRLLKSRNIEYNGTAKIDENYLLEIDSHDKAQLLGFLYADGCLTNGSVTIALSKIDEAYLQSIKHIISSSKKIYNYPARNNIFPCGRTAITKETSILSIHNKKFYENCIKWGLCPKKTIKNLAFPNISPEFYSSFILGLFEGDGSIGLYSPKKNDYKQGTCVILATENIAKAIQKILYNELDIQVKCVRMKNYNNGLHRIRMQRKSDLIKIYNWFYGIERNFFMERKKEKWQHIINHITNKQK